MFISGSDRLRMLYPLFHIESLLLALEEPYHLYAEIDLKTCVEKRVSEGGTSVASVEAQIAYVNEVLNHDEGIH